MQGMRDGLSAARPTQAVLLQGMCGQRVYQNPRGILATREELRVLPRDLPAKGQLCGLLLTPVRKHDGKSGLPRPESPGTRLYVSAAHSCHFRWMVQAGGLVTRSNFMHASCS